MRLPVTSRIMTRTTLDLDASVLAELRRRGREEGKSMGRLASELLATALDATAEEPTVAELDWVSADLGTPRVDLEDSEAVWALLDGRP